MQVILFLLLLFLVELHLYLTNKPRRHTVVVVCLLYITDMMMFSEDVEVFQIEHLSQMAGLRLLFLLSRKQVWCL